MAKILDFEEMKKILASLNKNIIIKQKPIGYTYFGYPIDHYTYGHGDYHLIITAGTHAVELITNAFVINFMKQLSQEKIKIDPNKYTIHFIPIVNPEGTIVVTSAIRNLIPRGTSEDVEQTYCLTYYRNVYLEGLYATKYNDQDIKLQQWMFRYAGSDCIDDKHAKLKNNIKDICQKYHLPKGILINWASNGRGIDLNSNIELGTNVEKIKQGIPLHEAYHLNTISRNYPGAVGCPYLKVGEIEKENQALLNFYTKTKENHHLIGSLIYHSCGNLIYYLNDDTLPNPWNKNYGVKEMNYNYNVAKAYGNITNYKLDGTEPYTTMDAKLKTLVPGTLLVELGSVRGNPLSQFLDLNIPHSHPDFQNVYTKIMQDNTKAIVEILPIMQKEYDKYHNIH